MYVTIVIGKEIEWVHDGECEGFLNASSTHMLLTQNINTDKQFLVAQITSGDRTLKQWFGVWPPFQVKHF